ncbi:MAG TPA: ATP-binding protein [Actinomycetota bacterium]|nr:ATP-binding protein [Actinomycetota bacterium]
MLEMTQGEPGGARTKRHKLVLPAIAGSARQARQWVCSLSLRGTPHDLESVQLLVSELVTNSVRHSGLSPDDEFELHVQIEPGRVRVEVADCGTGFDQRGRVQPSLDGGFGLFFVQEMSSRWGLDCDERTRVWFELDFGGHTAVPGENSGSTLNAPPAAV